MWPEAIHFINPKSEVTDAKQTSRQQQGVLNNTYQQQGDKHRTQGTKSMMNNTRGFTAYTTLKQIKGNGLFYFAFLLLRLSNELMS